LAADKVFGASIENASPIQDHLEDDYRLVALSKRIQRVLV